MHELSPDGHVCPEPPPELWLELLEQPPPALQLLQPQAWHGGVQERPTEQKVAQLLLCKRRPTLLPASPARHALTSEGVAAAKRQDVKSRTAFGFGARVSTCTVTRSPSASAACDPRCRRLDPLSCPEREKKSNTYRILMFL